MPIINVPLPGETIKAASITCLTLNNEYSEPVVMMNYWAKYHYPPGNHYACYL